MRAGLAMYFVTLADPELMELAGTDRRRARDRALLQHPARRRHGDRDQPAHLDGRLPGGPQPALPRRQAGARRDLRRRAARARRPRTARPHARCATSTSSSSMPARRRALGLAGGRQAPRRRRCGSPTARSTSPASPGRTSRRCAAPGVDARLVVVNRGRLHPEADWSLDRRGALPRRLLTQFDALARLLPHDRHLPLLLRAHARPEVAAVPDPAGDRQEERLPLPRLRHPRQDARRSSPTASAPTPRSSAPTLRCAGCPRPTSSRPGSTCASSTPVPPSGNRRPLVVHAPSNRDKKGTQLRDRGLRSGCLSSSRSSRAFRTTQARERYARRRHRRRPAERRLARRLRARGDGARQAGRRLPRPGGASTAAPRPSALRLPIVPATQGDARRGARAARRERCAAARDRRGEPLLRRAGSRHRPHRRPPARDLREISPVAAKAPAQEPVAPEPARAPQPRPRLRRAPVAGLARRPTRAGTHEPRQRALAAHAPHGHLRDRRTRLGASSPSSCCRSSRTTCPPTPTARSRSSPRRRRCSRSCSRWGSRAPSSASTSTARIPCAAGSWCAPRSGS